MQKKIWVIPASFVIGLLLLAKKTPESSAQIPLGEAPVIGRALHYIEKDYFDPAGLDPKKLFEEASHELESSIAPFMAKIEEKKIHLSYAGKTADFPAPSPLAFSDLPLLFRQTLSFLDLNYQGRLDEQEREYLAVSGMVNSLDPHTNFLSPKIYQEFKIGTRGTFGGLGIVIGIRDGDLSVIAPVEGTPAWRAGIQVKDRIIQIDEEATINMSLTEAVEKLRGPIGSKVTLLVQRGGASTTPLRFLLTRAKIEIQAVAGRLLEGNRIGLVKIKHFQEDTIDKFDELVLKFRKKSGGLQGLILDLRNNPGGLLDQAIEMGDRFLAEGVVVKTVGRRSQEVEEAKPGSPLESIPLVVLVNEGSASASEIVAGSLQQTRRALVIGNLTFGKGTVQTLYDLRDGSALKLTIAKYLTAGDREVQSIGIRPDIELIPTRVEKESVNLFEDEPTSFPEENLTRIPATDATFHLRYLANSLKKSEDEESYQFDLGEDFSVQLAKKILESSGTPPSQLVETAGQEEKKRIQESLGLIGIDWSLGPKTGAPQPVVTLSLTDKGGKSLKSLSPGGSASLKIEVENHGSGDLYQFAAVGRSDNPLFSNLEFPFGRLKPGEKRAWTQTIKIADNAIPRNEPVQLNFYEAYQRLPSPVTLDLSIEEAPLPSFSYSYSIHDGDEKGTSGNRNGIAEKGEMIGLRVLLKNQGPSEKAEPVVNLKNLNGPEIFIKKGRVEPPPITLGGQASALLLFRIMDKIPKEYAKLSLELSIRDKKRDPELTDRIEFPMKPGGLPLPSPGVWHEPPKLLVTFPSLRVEQGQLTIKGKASDDQSVQHVLVFVGRNKAAYLPSLDNPSSFSFETKVTLNEGANLVTVAAQDNRELTSRRQWIIWRKKQ
ncbi:MAG: PDZ domain-containing protein [Deltaproteobacteria bacterium]|nr:PDZ domain-containing protein [Deltaproteobacteria bacterium]MBI4373774.1 PDZ domain-containing protein [Deltaproteobacteria bacterium]